MSMSPLTKTKSTSLILLLLLNACGLMKNDRLPEPNGTTQKVELFNQMPDSYKKTHRSISESKTQTLGVFRDEELPEFLKEFPSGTEIGTLSVVFEEEFFELAYLEEAIPRISKQEEETDLRVILKKTEEGSALVIRTSSGVRLKTIEEPITVLSGSFEYCSQIETEEKQIPLTVFKPHQTAECSPDQKCRIEVRIPRASNEPKIIEVPLTHEFLNARCVTKKTHYRNSELRFNRRVPKKAIIRLDSTPSHESWVMTFIL